MSSTSPQDFGTPLLLEDYVSVPQPVTATNPPLCAACYNETSLQRCSSCKNIRYCSATCQQQDWPLHRLLCKQFTATSPPGPTYRRALYLPDKETPRFVWLQYGDDGVPLDKARYFAGTPVGEVRTIAFHNRYRPYWIQVSYDCNDTGRELRNNKSVMRLLGSENEVTTGLAWRGQLLVIAYSAEDGLNKPALDVGVDVLGPLVEYLRLRNEYHGPVFVEQPQERCGEGEWTRIVAGARR